MMDRPRRNYLGINLIGGVAVLGSYAHGLLTHPGQGTRLWGSMPETLIPWYVGMMPLAAVGYLLAFAFLLRTPAAALTIQGQPALPQLSFTTATFLIASTWWMPLCWAALDSGNPDLLNWIQLTLMVAGASALINLIHLARLDPTPTPWLQRAAVAGMVFLVIQCTILDGFIWPRFFSIPTGTHG